MCSCAEGRIASGAVAESVLAARVECREVSQSISDDDRLSCLLPRSSIFDLLLIKWLATGAVPLVIRRDPISVTCGILESDNIIVDPSEEEESVCKGFVTVVVDDEGQPCYISQVRTTNTIHYLICTNAQ